MRKAGGCGAPIGVSHPPAALSGVIPFLHQGNFTDFVEGSKMCYLHFDAPASDIFNLSLMQKSGFVIPEVVLVGNPACNE